MENSPLRLIKIFTTEREKLVKEYKNQLALFELRLQDKLEQKIKNAFLQQEIRLVDVVSNIEKQLLEIRHDLKSTNLIQQQILAEISLLPMRKQNEQDLIENPISHNDMNDVISKHFETTTLYEENMEPTAISAIEASEFQPEEEVMAPVSRIESDEEECEIATGQSLDSRFAINNEHTDENRSSQSPLQADEKLLDVAGQQAIVDFNVKEEIEHGAVVVEIVNTEKTLCKDNLIEGAYETAEAIRTCPEGLCIRPSKVKDGEYGVWAVKPFSNYKCAVTSSDQIRNTQDFSNFLNKCDPQKCTWMSYIQYARNPEEHNLLAYQQNEKLIFQVNKRIKEDTELLLCFMESGPIQTSLNKNADEFQEAPSCSSVVPAPIDQYKCMWCNGNFLEMEALTKHLKLNHSDLVVKREFESELKRGLLKTHDRNHVKEKPFSCPICSKEISTKANLKTHIRIHTQERPYKCRQCGQAFMRPDYLKTHIIRMHTTLQPFVCKICGYGCTNRPRLRKHIASKHPNSKP